MRLAEVWLDEYKEYFYEHIGKQAVSYNTGSAISMAWGRGKSINTVGHY